MTIVTAAIVQEPPAVLDLAESVERAVAHVAGAASSGADLVVFPETWLTCYPAWAFGMAGWRDADARRWHARLLAESPVVDATDGDADDLAPLRAAARENRVTIVMGVNERAARHGGSLFNSIVTIGTNGETLNVHRKLVPTHTERIIWAPGDAAGLRTVDTPAGAIGGLVCWEHFNPLARHALHAQNEEVHIALWPDMPESHVVAARSYALEGRCWVISAGQYLAVDDVPDELADAYRVGSGGTGDVFFDGGSHIVAPDGSFALEPVFGRHGILLAELDTSLRYGELLDLDIAGHSARPDVFELTVDRRRRGSGVHL